MKNKTERSVPLIISSVVTVMFGLWVGALSVSIMPRDLLLGIGACAGAIFIVIVGTDALVHGSWRRLGELLNLPY